MGGYSKSLSLGFVWAVCVFCETFGNLGLFLQQQKKVKYCRSGESFGDKEWPTA